jgi:hypothetical protein
MAALGAVVATVPVEFVTELLASARAGPKGLTMLRYDDLSLVSAYPALEGALNEMGNRDVPDDLRQLLTSGAMTGSTRTSLPGGGERVGSMRRLQGLPFILVVSVLSESYLEEWRGDVLHTALLALVFLVLSTGAAMLVIRYHRRQRAHAARLKQTLADLRNRDQALGITERVGGLGVFSIDLHSGQTHNSPQFLEIFGVRPGEDFPRTYGVRGCTRTTRRRPSRSLTWEPWVAESPSTTSTGSSGRMGRCAGSMASRGGAR